MTNLRAYIDHTLLHPAALPKAITRLCEEAIEHSFKAVCVNSGYVPHARAVIGSNPVELAATVGFPLGAGSTATKVAEAFQAIKSGATEIDMVLQIGWLKARMDAAVVKDIQAVKKAIGPHVLKVIIETAFLDRQQMRQACELIAEAGGDFVKTSTGFAPAGAKLEDVKLLKQAAGDRLRIKASGGIGSGRAALEFIAAGAQRIGTSKGITLLKTV